MPENTNDAGNQTETGGGQQTVSAESFEAWLEAQPEEVRALYDAHIQRLKGALNSEREMRSRLEKQLKRIAKGEEIPDAVRQQIEELTTKLSAASRRAAFMAKATEHGAMYPDLLYAAVAEKLQDDADLSDPTLWEGLRKKYPPLFRPASGVVSNGDAGAGGDEPPAPKKSFDDVIRKLARG